MKGIYKRVIGSADPFGKAYLHILRLSAGAFSKSYLPKVKESAGPLEKGIH